MSFPHEFADLLNSRGRKLLNGRRRFDVFHRRGATPLVLFDDLIDRKTARHCFETLDGAIRPVLRKMYAPIPREQITKLRNNYSESLPKTVRAKTFMLNSDKSRAFEIAQAISLAQMMKSESFIRFGEAIVGASLRRERWGRQIICYEAGDHSGPHNDHHPETETSRNGYVDLHITFSNRAARSQWLVYEERGFLSASHKVSKPSCIAVYRLPFWHYTTPLVARPGQETEARRWLLLGTFDYEQQPPKLRYR